MKKDVIGKLKHAYRVIKGSIAHGKPDKEGEYFWIYDNFHLIDKHYRAALQSKQSLRRAESAGCFAEVETLCAQNDFIVTDQDLCRLVSGATEEKFGATQIYAIPIMLSTAALLRIGQICDGLHSPVLLPAAVSLLRMAGEFDTEQLFACGWAPEQVLLQNEEDYALFSEETRHFYRHALAAYCRAEHVGELSGANALARKAAAAGKPMGSFLFRHKQRNATIYALLTGGLFICFGSLSVLAVGWFALIALLPIYECTQMLADFLTSFFIRIPPVLRLEPDKIPPTEKTLVVVTTLLFGAQQDGRVFDSLERFYLLNPQENIYFGVLGDLPDSKMRYLPDDTRTLNYAIERIDALNAKYGARFGLFFRERVENPTDKIFGGRERKRGAVSDLCAFIKGKKAPEAFWQGGEFYRSIKYVLTLDGDTNLSLGSVNELLSVARHPVNRPVVKNGKVREGYGIFQPVMRTELSAAFKTRFSRLISGIGGTDSYESAAFDRYQSIYGSGVFCGKGLLDVGLFDALITPVIPDGKVLSHDIVEGEILRTMFVPDVSMTDSVPKNTLSFTGRLHRWIRGDVQNSIFLSSPSPLGRLGKLKLRANLRRHLSPILSVAVIFAAAFVKNEHMAFALLVLAFLPLLVPCLLSLLMILFTGRPIAFRRFFSQASSAAAQSVFRTIYEISGLAHMAAVAADAVLRALWRMKVSRQKLLQWVTASEGDASAKSGLAYYIRKCLPSAVFGAGLFFFALTPLVKLLGLAFFVFPLIAYAESKPLSVRKPALSENEKQLLREHTKDMWNFFADHVGKKTNYLPPDNVQFAPVEAVAYRSSPTNIGFYLVSALAAFDLGFLDRDELLTRLEKSIDSIEKLEKYNGHLYNWYELKTLAPLGTKYVSTVDSGNFVTMLVALREGLIALAAEEDERLQNLTNRVQRLIADTDFHCLYDHKKSLFCLGLDASTGKPDSVYYDLFMSEARLTSFYALAAGVVPKKHWKRLGRTLTASNGYVGMISWSGTAFEYLMPPLFLPIYRNSFQFESLHFAVAEQKRDRSNGLWGKSESGFYSFDSDMNYQYKAHGVQKIALKRYRAEETVLAPYASYLALCVASSSAIRNIKRFTAAGMYGKYGLFEALDLTVERAGQEPGDQPAGVAVRSYMAHHLGMSIIACVNALEDNVFVKRFMTDAHNAACYELLQEKIPTDAHLFEDGRNSYAPDIKLPLPKKHKTATETENPLQAPAVTCISRGALGLVCSGSGHVQLRQDKYMVTPPGLDLYSLKNSLTVRFGMPQDGETDNNQPNPVTPIDYHGCSALYQPGVYSFERGSGWVSHISSSRAFSGRVKYTIHPTADCFTAETRADSGRDYRLLFAFEPLLANERDFLAHPSFSRLFVQAEYDAEDKIIYFSRRPRGENENTVYLAVALSDPTISFAFTTRKDGFPAWGLEEDSAIETAVLNNDVGPCVNPICILRTEPVHGGRVTLLLGMAFRKKDAKAQIMRARGKAGLLARDKDTGFFPTPDAERFLRALIFPEPLLQVEEFSGGGVADLWAQGISGDYPIIALLFSQINKRAVGDYLRAFFLLARAGQRFDLVFLSQEGDRYNRPIERSIIDTIESLELTGFVGRKGGIFIRSAEEENFHRLIKHSAVLYLDVEKHLSPPRVSHPIHNIRLPITSVFDDAPSVKPEYELAVYGGGFLTEGFRIEKEAVRAMPYSYVLPGRRLSAVISDSSLCYSFVDNAREKRITQFTGDPYTLPNGERLFATFGGQVYDLCACARGTTYANGVATFTGQIADCAYTVSVAACERKKMKLIRVKQNATQHPITFVTRPAMGPGLTLSDRLQLKKMQVPNASGLLFRNPLGADFSHWVGFVCLLGEGVLQTDYAKILIGEPSGLTDIAGISGEGEELFFLLGAEKSEEDALRLIVSMDRARCEREFERSVDFVRSLQPPIQLESRSRSISVLFNHFLSYQAAACRMFSRGSFYQSGGAYGFRDQLQDCLCLVYSNPALVRSHIVRACAHQYPEGDVQHWWHQSFSTIADKGVRTKCSDDFLWLPYVVADYVKKTGDFAVLSLEVEYIQSPPLTDKVERYEQPERSGLRESVYKHCLRALSNGEKFGMHGLSLMGSCDWNDAFSAVGAAGKGESVFTTLLFVLTLQQFGFIIKHMGDYEVEKHYDSVQKSLMDAFEKHAYIGEWYCRAFHDDGSVLGVRGNEECEIDLLPQSFAAMIKGWDERVSKALDHVSERLFDRRNRLLKLFDPPFADGNLNVGYIRGYVAGIRENGGQYTHAAIWAAIGFICAGKYGCGLEIINAINPALKCSNEKDALTYKTEPYAIAADVYSAYPHGGRGGWSWYTGAAAWYYKAIFEYVMGIELTEGFSVISVNPITVYNAVLKYNDYTLTVSVTEEESTLLDGVPTTFPLKIPSGHHVLTVPVLRE